LTFIKIAVVLDAMATFIKCLEEKVGLYENSPVNLDQCKYLTRTYHNNEYGILFVGCDMAWKYTSEETRDKQYFDILINNSK